jgi:hypothetical protein
LLFLAIYFKTGIIFLNFQFLSLFLAYQPMDKFVIRSKKPEPDDCLDQTEQSGDSSTQRCSNHDNISLPATETSQCVNSHSKMNILTATENQNADFKVPTNRHARDDYIR